MRFTGRGADLVVECLVRAGIQRLFGVPGDTGVVLYDALYHRTADITHVLARDERHAAAMADGYARASNTVGVVEVSSGGGTTYAVGGLGEAFASSVPVLLVTSDIHTASRGTGALTGALAPISSGDLIHSRQTTIRTSGVQGMGRARVFQPSLKLHSLRFA